MPGFPSVIQLSSLDGTNGFRLDGIDAGDSSGQSVASAGDVNGDGIADILIGAYLADPNGVADGGESYVVFGKTFGFAAALDLAALNGTNGFRLDGIDAFDISGISVSSAGDVNGDGFDDILIGASRGDPGGDGEAGESYVVFGKAGGFTSSFDLASLNGTSGFRLDGIDTFDLSGHTVASAGDVNGDGFDDIVIGAFHADAGGDAEAGESYVVFGKAGGFTSSLDLASLNGTNGFRLDGIDAGDFSGISVASAGDVNGDGFADIVIGAFLSDAGGDADAGESYVVFGKAVGFAASLDLASLNGTNGFRLDGIAPNDICGHTVASAGDVNGDGFADILINAPYASPGGRSFAGESYVVFGKASGFAASLDLSTLNGVSGFQISGNTAYDAVGVPVRGSASSAGDVNGDGFTDILIGFLGGDPGGDESAGETYVVFGKAGGFAANLDLSTIDGANGFRLDGISAGDNSGKSVFAAGDVNGDGFDDILIGAPGADGGAGESYVIFGRATTGARDDNFAIAEDGGVAGNVFADNGHGVDTHLTGGALAVAKVNGVATNVGQQIALASGALVRVQANGTLAYNPNDAFDHLPAPGSGAANASATDSFTYALAGGSDATVTVTVTGVDSNDLLIGTTGADTLDGGIGDDRVTSVAGNDVLDGGGGNDRLFGGGQQDTLRGGGGSDRLAGQAGGDTLLGQSGNDKLSGASGNDRMTGGDGADAFVFDVLAFGSDSILDYQDGSDRIWFKSTVADAFVDLVIDGNGTAAVTLSVAGIADQSIRIQSSAPVTLAAADVAFFT